MNAQAITSTATSSKTSVVFVCVLAALAGLMFGLDIGVISGATQFIQAEYKVSDHIIEWIVSSMMFGAAVGALAAGWLSATLGRKRSLDTRRRLVHPWLAALGLRLVAGNADRRARRTGPGHRHGHLHRTVVPGRSGAGTHSRRDDLDLSADDHHRHPGRFPLRHRLQLHGAWRWMLGIIAIPGVLFLLGVLFLPDSPRWLIDARSP